MMQVFFLFFCLFNCKIAEFQNFQFIIRIKKCVYCINSILQVILIGRVVSFYMSNTPGFSREDLYLSSAGVILCCAVKSFTFMFFDLGISESGMEIRVTLCSAIYRKVSVRETSGVHILGFMLNVF